MIDKILLIPIIASFFVTLFVLPFWIRRAKKAGLTGKDIHKNRSEEVAEAGGIATLCGFCFGALLFIGIDTFFFQSSENSMEILAVMTTILLVGFVGFTDDILGWKIGLRRRTRMILIIFTSIPLIVINAGKSVMFFPFLGQVEFGIFYPLVLIPLAVMGATTTYNFLAGWNGLEAGQGIIFLSAMAIVSYFTGSFWLCILTTCMIFSLAAFLIFNFFPAKVFPGDSLTYIVGGMIATTAILGNFEKIAVFFFIPYIAEIILKCRGKLVKESFGQLQEDGSVDLRYEKIYSLTHLSIYLMKKFGVRPTERKVVFSIWALQILIIIVGMIIFREGIFT